MLTVRSIFSSLAYSNNNFGKISSSAIWMICIAMDHGQPHWNASSGEIQSVCFTDCLASIKQCLLFVLQWGEQYIILHSLFSHATIDSGCTFWLHQVRRLFVYVCVHNVTNTFKCMHKWECLSECTCVLFSCVCVCWLVLQGLQCPSVNLSCHVETLAWHFSPLVLHGEQRAQPTASSVVRDAVILFISGWSLVKSITWPLQMRNGCLRMPSSTEPVPLSLLIGQKAESCSVAVQGQGVIIDPAAALNLFFSAQPELIKLRQKIAPQLKWKCLIRTLFWLCAWDTKPSVCRLVWPVPAVTETVGCSNSEGRWGACFPRRVTYLQLHLSPSLKEQFSWSWTGPQWDWCPIGWRDAWGIVNMVTVRRSHLGGQLWV